MGYDIHCRILYNAISTDYIKGMFCHAINKITRGSLWWWMINSSSFTLKNTTISEHDS